MAKGVTLIKEEVMKAIENRGGIISQVASAFNCDWHTIKNFIDKDPELTRQVEVQRERFVDLNEECLRRLVNEANVYIAKVSEEAKIKGHKVFEEAKSIDYLPVLKYCLNTLGKGRGYGSEFEDVKQVNFNKIDVNIVKNADR